MPKHITNVQNFINSLNNIFINDTINNNTTIRHDYVTKSMILLIEKEKLNKKFKWIQYETFKLYLNMSLKNEDILENDIDNFIKSFKNIIL